MTDGLDTRDLDQLETLDADGPAEAGRAPGGVAIGDRIADKYLVTELLGHGGMGAVFLARDERLARDVAIKVGLAAGAGSLARAEREAQALAKLTHPNVVVIYEVGELKGQLFVAMEYVKGGTARAWLKAKPRSWREIVALYAEAGAGLAAAHAAGIVHRDFKPDNVLVGDDGRPRVADFGLARAPGGPDTMLGSSPSSPSEPLSNRLTRTGAAVGTPAYMAPEQLELANVDERVDQFAFCVALWEALYGTRPFEGRSRDQLRAAMRVPPKTTNTRKIPRHVTEALRRGLARDPAERWPTMSALVARLRHERPRLGLAIAIGATVAAAALVPMIAMRAGDPCNGGEAELARAWSPIRELALQVAFVGAGGEAAWATVDAQLRDYANRWLDAERVACRATHDGGQSQAMLDKRVACLFDAHTRLAAVSDSLAGGDKRAVISATSELGLLPQLDACANVEALAHEIAPPTDPIQRARVAAVEDAIATVHTQYLRNEPIAPATLDQLVAQAHETRWAPLEGSAMTMQGDAQIGRGELARGRKTLESAVSTFLAAGDDDGAAVAMVDLAYSFGNSGLFADEQRWTRLAEGLAHRLHDPPGLGSQIASLDALALEAGPRKKDAAPLRMRQVELATLAFHDPVNAAVGHLNRAGGYIDADDYPSALREFHIGLAAAEHVLGPDHPDLINFLHDLADADGMLGHFDDAERDSQRSIALIERWYGPTSGRLVTALQNQGAVRQRRGDLRGALAVDQRALDIELRIDPDSEDAATIEANIAIVQALSGDLAGAAPHARDATARLEHIVGPNSGMLTEDYVLVGFVERGLGHLEPSRVALAHAVALADAADSDRINPREELSYTLVLMHRGPEAVAELGKVATIADKDEPRIAAEYHFAVGKALASAGDRAKSRAEVARAKAAYSALGADFKDALAEVVAFDKTL